MIKSNILILCLTSGEDLMPELTPQAVESLYNECVSSGEKNYIEVEINDQKIKLDKVKLSENEIKIIEFLKLMKPGFFTERGNPLPNACTDKNDVFWSSGYIKPVVELFALGIGINKICATEKHTFFGEMYRITLD